MAVPTPGTLSQARQDAARLCDHARRARDLAGAFEAMATERPGWPVSLNAHRAAERVLDVLPSWLLLDALKRRL